VDGPIGIFDIEIAGIDAGVVGGGVALYERWSTGILSILSAAGADRAEAKINAISINFID